MILKRWALNLISLVAGGGVGLWTVHYARQMTPLPPLAAVFIALFFMALFFALSCAAGPWLFPGPGVQQIIRPEMPRQPWAWLKPVGGTPKSGYPLNKEQILIGRDVRCDIMFKDESVSRRHAEVIRLAEGYLLRDLGSRNGTFVNGQRIQEYLLQEGDSLSLGDVDLVFEAPRHPAMAGPESPGAVAGRPLLSPERGTPETRPPGEGDTEVWRPE